MNSYGIISAFVRLSIRVSGICLVLAYYIVILQVMPILFQRHEVFFVYVLLFTMVIVAVGIPRTFSLIADKERRINYYV